MMHVMIVSDTRLDSRRVDNDKRKTIIDRAMRFSDKGGGAAKVCVHSTSTRIEASSSIHPSIHPSSSPPPLLDGSGSGGGADSVEDGQIKIVCLFRLFVSFDYQYMTMSTHTKSLAHSLTHSLTYLTINK